MRSLRHQVQQLEENELFEQTLMRGSQAILEQPPTTNDIDVLMQSMMGVTTNTTTHGIGQTNGRQTRTNGNFPITNGPWNSNGPYYEDGAELDSANTSGATAGKRSRNGISRQARR